MMDQVKIGGFIAQLRREKGWTQEELGEQIGVTNKTVSRWENGNYMPGIEILTLLGEKFGVSLNELLEGRRLDDTDFRAAADEKLASALKRPGERLRRWLGQYGGFAAVVLLLCCIIGLSWGWQYRYRTEHPEDVQAAGTYSYSASGYPIDLEYIVLLKVREGHDFTYEYYRYRPLEALERGTWQADGAMVTVTVDEKSFQMLIKADCLYVPDGEGLLTAYQKIADHGVFNSIDYEDFDK